MPRPLRRLYEVGTSGLGATPGLGTVSPEARQPLTVSPPLPRASNIVELTATGFDENLQAGFGGDPLGGMASVGLRVPTLPTPDAQHRYLFLLATFAVPERMLARIIGYRQLSTIGLLTQAVGVNPPIYPTEFLITSPMWRFPDGNISWHIHELGPPAGKGFPFEIQGAAVPLPQDSFAFRYAHGPALLYETATLPGALYVDLSAYTPPNQGRPWGKPIRSGFGTFYDNHAAYNYGEIVPIGADIEGPATIAYFASVCQTNPFFRARPGVPVVSSFYAEGMAPEDQFLLNFNARGSPSPPGPGSPIYWRVGGSLLVELTGGE